MVHRHYVPYTGTMYVQYTGTMYHTQALCTVHIHYVRIVHTGLTGMDHISGVGGCTHE